MGINIKKRCLLLAAVLLCALCTPALAVEYNAADIYTIHYDAAVWQLDDMTYSDEASDEYVWLFMLYNAQKDVLIDASIEKIPEFEGLTLFMAGEAERNEYLRATLDAFQDQSIKHIATILPTTLEIPFYVYSLEDEEGGYVYAETIVNGNAIIFNAYHGRSTGSTDALLPALEEVLATFTPVMPAQATE